MARPRNPDRKLPLSVRLPPSLMAQLERFAAAMGGVSSSQAVETALDHFFLSGGARRVIEEQAAERDRLVAVFDAELHAAEALRQLAPTTQDVILGRLAGLSFREVVRSSRGDMTERDAKQVASEAQQRLGHHYATLANNPALVDRLRRSSSKDTTGAGSFWDRVVEVAARVEEQDATGDDGVIILTEPDEPDDVIVFDSEVLTIVDDD